MQFGVPCAGWVGVYPQRYRMTSIESAARGYPPVEGDSHDLARELGALYDLGVLVESADGSVERLLAEVAERLPRACQRPEQARIRVCWNDREFLSPAFRPGAQCLRRVFAPRNGLEVGVELHYPPASGSGEGEPVFTLSERRMLDAVVERLGRVVQRITTEADLRERIRELQFHSAVSRLANREGIDTEAILERMLKLLMRLWGGEGVCCASARLGEQTFSAGQPCGCEQFINEPLLSQGQTVGQISVQLRPKGRIENQSHSRRRLRRLVQMTAARLGRVIERRQIDEQLRRERQSLTESNIALRQVLEQVGNTRRDLGRELRAKVEKLILPLVDEIEQAAGPKEQQALAVLREQLNALAEPLAGELSSAFDKLTPVEVQICEMVRRGLATKEIARLRHVSVSTVHRHREHIRKKLGLVNQAANLATFLNRMASRATGPVSSTAAVDFAHCR